MTSALEQARIYAELGWRVVPIPHGQKHPRLLAWQDNATTDAGQIERWFENDPTAGVGIACGRASGVFVLDVDVSGDKQGTASLKALEAEYGPLPETVQARTGTGGTHYYFAYPASGEIRNDAGKKLGKDLDIRGEGGQVLAPPTVHPNGRRYAWQRDPTTTPLAPAPFWLLDLLQEPVRREPSSPVPALRPQTEPEDGPAAWFNANHSWDELMGAWGWRLAKVAGEESYWMRPGVDDHHGATTNHQGRDVLKVFTPSVEEFEEGAAYSKFGAYAAMAHGGDRSQAAREIRTQMMERTGTDDDLGWVVSTVAPIIPIRGEADTEPDASSWLPVDLRPVLSGTLNKPKPTVLLRSDGIGLFYAGKVNAVNGEPSGGKSWLGVAACAEQMELGHDAVYIDLEDNEQGSVGRLRLLGVDDAVIAAHFLYVHPDEMFGLDAQAWWRLFLDDRDVTVLIIDSTGESMNLEKVKQNDDDEVTGWYRSIPRWFANQGPAVVTLDHVVKNPEGRGLWGIGSQRKRAAINGASYQITTITPFSQGKDGKVKLTVGKDRWGNYAVGDVAAEIDITEDDLVHIVVRIATSGAVDRYTGYMESISRWLEIHQGSSVASIMESVKGNTDYKKRALKTLIAEGFVRQEKVGRKVLNHSTGHYRENTDTYDLIVNDSDPTPTRHRPGSSSNDDPQTPGSIPGSGSGSSKAVFAVFGEETA